MARTPKLEIYQFILKPFNKKDYKSIQNFIDENIPNKVKSKSFTNLFKHVVSDIEKGKSFEDKTSDKKLRIFDKSKSQSLNKGISIHGVENYFEGIIGGGSSGIERIKIKSENNDEDELIEVGDTIYEPFYLFVYAPLDLNKGLIFVQTYTDDGISKTVRNYIKKIFSGEKYYNAEIQPWYPEYLIEECNKGKEIQKLIYTKTIIQKRLAENPLSDVEEKFTVKVIITPNKKNDNSKNLNEKSLLATFGDYALKTISEEFTFKNFKPQLSATTNQFNTPRIFEIGADNELMPVILLEKQGILVNKKGTPDFEKLKDYCADLFEKIKPEFRNFK